MRNNNLHAFYPLRNLRRPPSLLSLFLHPPAYKKLINPTQEEEYHADDDDHATDDHATTGDDGHRRQLAGGGSDTSGAYSNTGSDGETVFIVSGWLLLVLAVGNYVMSRWVELRLLKKAGCEGTHEYAERLTAIEKQTLEAKVGLSSGRGVTGLSFLCLRARTLTLYCMLLRVSCSFLGHSRFPTFRSSENNIINFAAS